MSTKLIIILSLFIQISKQDNYLCFLNNLQSKQKILRRNKVVIYFGIFINHMLFDINNVYIIRRLLIQIFVGGHSLSILVWILIK
jgi:hypothetical protein